MADEEDPGAAAGGAGAADDGDSSLLPLAPLPPAHRVLDIDDEPFPAEEDEENDRSSSSPPPASSSPKGKERGRFRIHNVGGSLTFLLQVSQCVSAEFVRRPLPHCRCCLSGIVACVHNRVPNVELEC